MPNRPLLRSSRERESCGESCRAREHGRPPNGPRLSCGAQSAAAAPMMELARQFAGAQAQLLPTCEAPSASSACKAARTRAASLFALLTSILAAEDRAKEEIVELIGQTLQAEQRGDLRPVTDFVHQNMDDNFSRCCS